MMGALAEFERALIIERTRAGMKAAKARGIEVGRKRALTPAQINHARQLVERGGKPLSRRPLDEVQALDTLPRSDFTTLQSRITP